MRNLMLKLRESMTKKRALKFLLIFFGAMILLTLLSRITYNFIVPKVEIQQVKAGTIEHRLDLTGRIEAKGQLPVYTQPELLISSMLVEPGSQVAEGDALYQIDLGSLEEILSAKRTQVSVLNGQIKEAEAAAGRSSEAGEPVDVAAATYSLRAERSQKNRELQGYQDLKNGGGVIRAPRAGVVTAVNTKAGEKTGGTADILMADSSSGFCLRVQTEAGGEGQYITGASEAAVSMPGGEELKGLTIGSITGDSEANTLEMIVDLPGEDFRIGQLADISIRSGSRAYENCIPRSALHLDGSDSYYVYCIQPEETILGEELKAVKQEVQVLDKNAQYAAVEGVFQGQQIIAASDRILEDGIKVRKLR